MHQFQWPKSGKVVVFDTEFTSWKGARECNWEKPGMARELVQIGAALLDGETFAVKETFEVLTQPTINPVLSDYFIDLTGITNKMLEDSAQPVIDGMRRLRTFIGDSAFVLSHGIDDVILRENCEMHSFPWLFEGVPFYNIHGPMKRALGLKKTPTSSELPGLAGLKHEGRAHTALDDALAIAHVLVFLRAEGKI